MEWTALIYLEKIRPIKIFIFYPFLFIVHIFCIYRHFSVVGILKMGWKKLYLYNKEGSRSEAMVYCLLDFYIHESKQRKGYGKRLIECMLQVINLTILYK